VKIASRFLSATLLFAVATFVSFSSLALPLPTSCALLLENASQRTLTETDVQAIVKSGLPITFQRAVDIVKDALPMSERLQFEEKANGILSSGEVQVKNQSGIFSVFGKSKRENKNIVSRLRPSSPNEKIIWKMRAATSKEELVGILFDTVRLVYQEDLTPIKALNVYYKSRGDAVASLTDVALKVLQLEYSIADGVFVEDPWQLPTNSKIWPQIRLWLRYLTLLSGPKIPWVYEGVQLNEQTASIIKHRDDDLLKKVVSGKLSTTTSVQWYVQHLKNVRRVAILSLSLFLGVEVHSAINYEMNIENTVPTGVSQQDLNAARAFEKAPRGDLQKQVQITLQNTQMSNLSEPERDFFKEVQKENTPQNTNLNPH
jgi:hypothetical protein